MIRTVYADLLFLINFSMDFLCFFLVSRLLSRPIALGRTVLASAFGGVYAVLTLFLPFRGGLLLLSDVLACAGMCLVREARRGLSLRDIGREILVYTGISMALGGIMTATYTALTELGIPDALPNETDGISAWLFLLLAAVGGGATLLGSRWLKRRTSSDRFLVTVTVGKRTVTLRALVDTGNSLADPISGTPAAAIDRTAVCSLLPELRNVPSDRATDLLAALSEENRTRARLLPVRTVTGNGMLLAFRPDRCTVAAADAPAQTSERVFLFAVAPIDAEDAEILLPEGAADL